MIGCLYDCSILRPSKGSTNSKKGKDLKKRKKQNTLFVTLAPVKESFVLCHTNNANKQKKDRAEVEAIPKRKLREQIHIITSHSFLKKLFCLLLVPLGFLFSAPWLLLFFVFFFFLQPFIYLIASKCVSLYFFSFFQANTKRERWLGPKSNWVILYNFWSPKVCSWKIFPVYRFITEASLLFLWVLSFLFTCSGCAKKSRNISLGLLFFFPVYCSFGAVISLTLGSVLLKKNYYCDRTLPVQFFFWKVENTRVTSFPNFPVKNRKPLERCVTLFSTSTIIVCCVLLFFFRLYRFSRLTEQRFSPVQWVSFLLAFFLFSVVVIAVFFSSLFS